MVLKGVNGGLVYWESVYRVVVMLQGIQCPMELSPFCLLGDDRRQGGEYQLPGVKIEWTSIGLIELITIAAVRSKGMSSTVLLVDQYHLIEARNTIKREKDTVIVTSV